MDTNDVIMVEIKLVEKKDLPDVVSIHKDAFRNFFLTELGDNFLKLYYKSVLKHKSGVLLGYFIDNKIVGFCAATTLSRAFHRNLVLDNFVEFFCAGIAIFFSKPKALVRLLKNFTKNDPFINDTGNYAELLSIGVSSKIQGSGIGKALLSNLEDIMSSRDCHFLSLTTDFDDNEKAIGFYKRMGYDIMYDFVAYPERHMYRLIKNLQLV